MIRSATTIRSNTKHIFIDPLIAIAALNINPSYFYTDLLTFGFMFENLVARDLLIYSEAINGSLSFYNDRYGLEIDFILHLRNGNYALIEVKLGVKNIENGIKNLLKFKSLVKEFNKKNKNKMKEPTLLIIITGSGFAYKTKDNIFVIPITCLRP